VLQCEDQPSRERPRTGSSVTRTTKENLLAMARIDSAVDAAGEDRTNARLYWGHTDAHRAFTLVLTATALAGVAIAGTMAIVGLPTVDLHGPLHRLGVMDPFCGGTRAARHTAQGRLGEAWRYNPLSILIVAGSVLLIARTALGLAGRRWLNLSLHLTPRARRALKWTAFALLVLLEIRQQMRADLLMAGTDTWV